MKTFQVFIATIVVVALSPVYISAQYYYSDGQ